MDQGSPGLVGVVDCTPEAIDRPLSGSLRTTASRAPRADLYRLAHAHGHLPLAPGIVTAIRSAIADNRPLISAFGVQLAASWLCCLYASQPLFTGIGEMSAMLFTAVPVFAAMWLAISLVRRRPQSKPLRGAYSMAWKDVRATWLTGRWFANLAVALVILPTSISIFSAAKRPIPIIHPFTWDHRLEDLERRLHGGRQAWEWIQPLVGHPLVTVILDRFYHLGWSLLIIGTLALLIAAPVSQIRQRYLTAWVILSFIVTVAALAFSSAGPPFYDRVVGETDPYAALLRYLDGVSGHTPLLSAGGRSVLWNAYVHHINRFGYGISAMPSMHIATATLLACLAFRIRRPLGAAASGVVILMQTASVALGWHYAVDGYVGAAFAIVSWWLAGVVMRLYESVAPDHRPNAAA